MRIVLLGPQGAGKGTQAQRISERTGAKHISTGDLVRAEIRSGSELGETIKDYNDRGELVPDEIIIQMMRPYYAHLGRPLAEAADLIPSTSCRPRMYCNRTATGLIRTSTQ